MLALKLTIEEFLKKGKITKLTQKITQMKLKTTLAKLKFKSKLKNFKSENQFDLNYSNKAKLKMIYSLDRL